jgi:DNA polymerase I-like protein with 3'-5' exonuclease and polymerase domains
MKYQPCYAAAKGRPVRFAYSQAAQAGCHDMEVVGRGGDVVAGAHEIYRECGFTLSDLDVRGSVLPRTGGGWFTGTIDPRTPLTGPKEYGYKNMSALFPMVQIDLVRSQNCVPDVPQVLIRTMDEVLVAFQEAKPKYVSVDIEGKGTDIHLVGIGWSEDLAYVVAWQGTPEESAALEYIIHHAVGIFHNAPYDVPELEIAGVRNPGIWEDTMVLAALYNPGIKKGLQQQVLSWVDGATAWKGLVDHKRGFDWDGGRNGQPFQYRALWTEIMTRLDRVPPKNPWHWYCFYNGLDVAYTYRLHAQLRRFLVGQGRIDYYDKLLKPLHPYLVDMGLRGLPVNEKTRKKLVRGCRAEEKKAAAALKEMGGEVLRMERDYWDAEVQRLKQETLDAGLKLGQNKEYTSARNKLRTREKNFKAGFNLDATTQRAALVYDHLGLPTVGREGRSTQEKVLEELLRRLRRVDEDGEPDPMCTPKTGTAENACEILEALVTGKKNATWRRNFLSMPLIPSYSDKWPRLQTEYHLHRAATGRLASGANPDDADKKAKKQQLQNVPEPLRAPVEADPGMVMVGGDWSNVEWAVVQIMARRVPDWLKKKLGVPLDFHQKLLDRFLAGDLDAHRYLASFVFQKPEEEIDKKTERKRCKPYTHGRNYKGSPVGLAHAAGHTVAMSKRACKAHAKAFMPQAWWAWAEDFVEKNGYIETAFGWRRWFFEMEPKPTEILGTHIQGSAADLCKYVLLDIFRSVDRVRQGGAEWEVLTTTHDSILMQVPKEDEIVACNWLKKKMEQPIPFLDTPEYPKGVCFPADVASGPTWTDV